MRAACALAALVVTELLGYAGVFTVTDHVGFGLAFYFAVETATTVGYGDVVPHAGASHVVAVVMMLTVIPTLGALFGRLAAVHTIRMWHRRDKESRDATAALHRIAADLYKAQTGYDHPEAPSP